MKKQKSILFTVLLAFLLNLHLMNAQTAYEIMEKAFSRNQADTSIMTVQMVLREASGAQNPRKIMMAGRKTAQGNDSYVEFLSPADVAGVKFLTIGNKSGADDQRLWLPAAGKIRKIASADKNTKFMGSDFLYYDMEEKSVSDGKYELLKEESIPFTKDTVKKDYLCFVVSAVSADTDCPYSKTIVWVGKEDFFIYKSEMYNKKGALEKTLYILESRTVKNIIVPVRTIAASVNGHKTLLASENIEINNPVDTALFTVQNLQK